MIFCPDLTVFSAFFELFFLSHNKSALCSQTKGERLDESHIALVAKHTVDGFFSVHDPRWFLPKHQRIVTEKQILEDERLLLPCIAP